MDATEAQGLLGKLLSVLKDPEEKLPEECGICLEVFAEDTAVVLRGCKHIFCHGCLEQVETTTCPLCRKRFKQSDRMSVEDIKVAIKKTKTKTKKNLVKAQIDDAAPKIKVLLAHIENMAADEKGLIFSQFTSSLDLIEDALEEAGHTFTRIDGSVDSEGRLEAMRGLESEDGPRFMLVSLKAGGEGITLTRASICYLMDPWWNAAAQDQAMDRCHRIGQTRPVRVYQLVMEDSIEQRMLSVQEAKTALGNGSVRKLSKEESKKARLTALRDLFQVNIAEQNWHGHFDEDFEHDDGRDLDDFIVGDDVED
ncbi:ISWI chromatin-remodeling complex ATPase ISW2 [Seminavis robusta]|uniref:ISWI chromatin-remodeling complex ATPase ISW2 n=1 Tax=Seminavis robusta TaxID=568900 RepID=A0A9N8EC65_9STRA|nr:ISWI chromatin-remodeling complex ATPase ISW2 [Seminavis robusta]|eukprot:Sro742_g195840.1 ISWI chromatin-remodeling complex ATPase ISW2 (310) ;mRNA; r:9477-10688